ncbi:DUF72 domain-containing protein [Hymenobacter busanensis]|uniref:DUF72 domain-containing protein n=1 Tax=Hymenobacter busanensis TaxID=2607656 RepID=A0A7L5A3Q8_9BACT|nr:DUF72 domain-containing protein [Hymenobacter busanensis]KAA9331406.1 DUF72 domain-containing protein [Hymenobacter busanensis]QHJ08560.1 DUF72 domain-containing protein [Hymenobacter busanensis]
MDFGRLPELQGIDFTLPLDHPDARALLQRADPAPAEPGIWVGCPTWTNKAWLGTWYPLGLRETEQLNWYARQFNSLEVNVTHYRVPDAETVRRWLAATPEHFRFCPKLPQAISHDRELFRTEDLTNSFCRALEALGPRLGTAFLQLPPTFAPPQLPRLERYLLDWPAHLPLAVELRHPAWYHDAGLLAETGALLEALGKTWVISDVASRRDVLHQRLTTPAAFVRFNGHALHRTDYLRADAWAERIAYWLSQGLHAVYFFIHQRDVNDAPTWAQYFLQRLSKLTGRELHLPKLVVQPVQGKLF